MKRKGKEVNEGEEWEPYIKLLNENPLSMVPVSMEGHYCWNLASSGTSARKELKIDSRFLKRFLT